MADVRTNVDREAERIHHERASREVGIEQIERYQRMELRLYAAERTIDSLESIMFGNKQDRSRDELETRATELVDTEFRYESVSK